MIELLPEPVATEKVARVANVFAALEIPNSAVEKHKVGLTVLINRALALKGDTQATRAIALGVAQPVISNKTPA